MKTCLIITGGSLDLSFAGSFLKTNRYDLVIAVDRGLDMAESLGLAPQIAVGDFDSVTRKTLSSFEADAGIRWERHKPEKDQTDTELAVSTAVSEGCEELTMLGATGGRMDHCLANIHLLLFCLQNKVRAQILDEKNRIYLLNGPAQFRRSDLWGNYLSFLPLTEAVTGITLEGFKYPLNNRTISHGHEAGLCISNELTGEIGRIHLKKGILVCVESHD